MTPSQTRYGEKFETVNDREEPQGTEHLLREVRDGNTSVTRERDKYKRRFKGRRKFL